MSALALPGFLAFFVVSLLVGVRLVRLAARTRRLPELLMGIGVLGIGPVGFGGIVVASGLAHDAPALSRLVAGAASAAVALGVAAKFLFNWRIYRPSSRLVALVSLVGVVAAAGTLAAENIATGFDTAAWRGPGWHVARSVLQVGCLLWGAGEALLYWRRMRRRVALGLADPLVADRFLLWGIGAGAAGLGSAIGTAVLLVSGRAPLEQTWVTMSSSLHGLVAAAALWLAFLPPAAYRRRVRARATGA